MDNDTPAMEIRSLDLAKNIAAFEDCLCHLQRNEIHTAVDIRYGLGGWAKALSLMCPRASIYGFEWDHRTFENATRPTGVRLIHRRFDRIAKPIAWPGHFDLLCADFNTLTMLKADPLREAIEVVQPRFLIFTDVACSKLHLNYKSYQLSQPDLFTYFVNFGDEVLPEWQWVHTSRFHYHAATTAWVKKRKA